jgi:hypothetical protein
MKNSLIISAMIALAAGVQLTSGCKKQDLLPAPIYQSYQVHYSITRNETRADAFFNYMNISGLRVTFPDQKVVRANGDTSLDLKLTSGEQFFHWEIGGTPEVVFTLTRRDGSILTNKANRTMMGELELVMDSVLYVSDTMRARWTGTPLSQTDYVAISMNRVYDSVGLHSGTSGGFFGPDSEDGHLCTFDYNQTSKFHPGTYDVLLVKERTVPLQQRDGEAGGTMQVSISLVKRVVVK